MRCASLSRRSARRATIATRAPSTASASAVASPIPEDAPVTIATLPSNFPGILSPLFLHCRPLLAILGDAFCRVRRLIGRSALPTGSKPSLLTIRKERLLQQNQNEGASL